MQNFYDPIPKSKLKKFPTNPHFELPFRMCVASPSGSGRSNTTLYAHLKDTIDNVQVIEEGQICAMTEFDSETSKLNFFDDLVMEPKRIQAQISHYFGIPKTIRINTQYIILGRNLTQRDLGIILSTMLMDIINRKIYKNVIEFVCDL
ncbi:uncharacterized protein PITG_01687 [Phytophthora infestans T30-4]|uniref:Uncharacterized protein n=1 Tax=Phytophthora infestans (strain T30-4) TaxID=403677 RepID=D0MTU4_PHYIT|nr:uncharacterized protein PITG_01687 [Phytophthora infestans T30-4]EEY61391.1 conserved hypothetical protein [Phytophthora infestans T30-4]|eukprot:XP_002908308.1 conserved hypothetical protein [Phytophthora infestans T30-4]